MLDESHCDLWKNALILAILLTEAYLGKTKRLRASSLIELLGLLVLGVGSGLYFKWKEWRNKNG